jgi:hypothetical protein
LNRDLVIVLLIIATSIGGFVKFGSEGGWVGLACVCFLVLLAFALRAAFGGIIRLANGVIRLMDRK